jgi:hypothetical protein
MSRPDRERRKIPSDSHPEVTMSAERTPNPTSPFSGSDTPLPGADGDGRSRRSRRLLAGTGAAVATLVSAGAIVVGTGAADAFTLPSASGGDTALVAAADGPASAADIEGLLYIRQEEKLAGDVYAVLADTWGLRVFSTIASAEEVHESETAAVLALYGIDDPIADLAAGEFLDPELQALYGDLVERGMTSEIEALMVGALIEETDIADLRDRATDEADIQSLYLRLEAGSQNHLRAFVRNLERRGVTYEAQVLGADDVRAILDGTDDPADQAAGSGRGR